MCVKIQTFLIFPHIKIKKLLQLRDNCIFSLKCFRYKGNFYPKSFRYKGNFYPKSFRYKGNFYPKSFRYKGNFYIFTNNKLIISCPSKTN